MHVWARRDDEERAHWAFAPLTGVGPLRFGMSYRDVAAALDVVGASMTRGSDDGAVSEASFQQQGVHAYFANDGRLACVAVDGLCGPQVMLDGQRLVGCVPSELEAWITSYTTGRGLSLCYTHAADAGSPDLGMYVRAQRAGDAVVTRPLFMVREWAEATWDHIPGSEWSTF